MHHVISIIPYIYLKNETGDCMNCSHEIRALFQKSIFWWTIIAQWQRSDNFGRVDDSSNLEHYQPFMIS